MQNVFSQNIHASFSDRNVFPIKMFSPAMFTLHSVAKTFLAPNLIKWKCVLFIIENYFSENFANWGIILSPQKTKTNYSTFFFDLGDLGRNNWNDDDNVGAKKKGDQWWASAETNTHPPIYQLARSYIPPTFYILIYSSIYIFW